MLREREGEREGERERERYSDGKRQGGRGSPPPPPPPRVKLVAHFFFSFSFLTRSRSKLTSPVLPPPSPIINCRRRPLLPLADNTRPNATQPGIPYRVASLIAPHGSDDEIKPGNCLGPCPDPPYNSTAGMPDVDW